MKWKKVNGVKFTGESTRAPRGPRRTAIFSGMF